LATEHHEQHVDGLTERMSKYQGCKMAVCLCHAHSQVASEGLPGRVHSSDGHNPANRRQDLTLQLREASCYC